MNQTALHLMTELENLREDLFEGTEILVILDEETPEDAARVVQVMAEVGSALVENVGNFVSRWDFAEDCRRGREKEAAAAAPAQAGTEAKA